MGSDSPDYLAGSSSTPPPALLDRGRKRTRTSTQTAGPRIDEHEWEGTGIADRWPASDEAPPVNSEHNPASDEDEEEDGFSEALADAILKRPGSIRGLSAKKGKSKENIRHTEFTFPSLSDFGNVNRYGASAEDTQGAKVQDEVPGFEERGVEAEGLSRPIDETLQAEVADQSGTTAAIPQQAPC